jgi:hypothetical protein
MKSFILRTLFGLFLTSTISVQARSQGNGHSDGFFEPNSLRYIDSVGTKSLSFATFFESYGSSTPLHLNFVGSPGISSYPSGFDVYSAGGGAQGTELTVYIRLDSLLSCTSSNGLFVDDTDPYGPGSPFSSFWVYCYVYNPTIFGRVRLLSDTLNFGSVSIGTDKYMSLLVLVDTDSSVFRELTPVNLAAPFSSDDSIEPEFNGCIVDPTQGNYFIFKPTSIKQYTDTTYLYDPIRKDSTMLILIGDGVAAGVAETTANEPAMQVYPNPCDQFANIVLPPEGLEKIEIRNALGAVVKSYRNVSSDFMLDVAALPGGIYLVEARSGVAVVTKKLVVIH